MRRAFIAALIAAGMVFASQAQTTVVDTDFTSGDGYVDADLAGQNDWVAIPSTGSRAFEVIDTSGAGVADTSVVSNFWDGVNGNFVYIDTAMSNNVDDVWSGVIDFQLRTYPAPGSTNAILGTTEVFAFGLTQSLADGLDVDDVNDFVFSCKVRGTTGFRVNLQEAGINNSPMITFSPDDLGWNPAGLSTNVSYNIFETDPLRLIWSIRKIRNSTDSYEAMVVLSNKVTGASSTHGTLLNTYAGGGGIFAADEVYYAIGHSATARGPDGTNSMVDLSIDALSVSYAEDQLPTIKAPEGLSAAGEYEQIVLAWDAITEADSYNVKCATAWEGVFSLVANVASNSYAHAGLTNGAPYYYKVSALYSDSPNPAVESSDSVQVGGSPSSKIYKSVLLDFMATGAKSSNTVLTVSNLAGPAAVASSNTGAPLVDPVKNAVTDTAGLSGVLKLNVISLDSGPSGDLGFQPDVWTGGVQSAGNAITVTDTGWGVETTQAGNDHLQGDETLIFTVDLSGLVLGEGQDLVLKSVSFYDQDHTRSGDLWMRNFDLPIGTNGAGVLLADNVEVYDADDLVLKDGDMLAMRAGGSATRLTGLEFDIVVSANGYQRWIAALGPAGSDAAVDFDLDGDGEANAWEYAFWGDAVDPERQGISPEMVGFVEDGGTNYIVYQHLRPKEYETCGLDVQVETSTDLPANSWTNTRYVVSDVVEFNTEYDSVTNRVSTEESVLFIRTAVRER